MHKKLEAELVSLAHSVLQMKNRDDVTALRDKAQSIYEKLAVLAYVDDYVFTTPNLTTSKEDLLKKIDKTLKTKDFKQKVTKPEIKKIVEKPVEDVIPKKEEDSSFFEPKFESVRIDLQSLKENQISSKEEFRDAISADKTASLFEETDASTSTKKTLNDRFLGNTIKVGLNDRIAFVNQLFNANQDEFNRVLSQLNTFATENEAKNFINTIVKPEYNWEGKETYEERFLALIERKFI